MISKVAITISTPAQFHFYRRIVENLEKEGVEVRLLFRDYGETLEIAEGYNGYIFSKVKTNWDRIYKFPFDVFRARKYLKDFKPELVTGFEIYAPYIAKLVNSRSFVFYDTEPKLSKFLTLQIKAYIPLVDAILTPSAYMSDLGEKQLRIDTFKEMAYLHPKYFKPDKTILEELGVDENEYAIVRFNAFNAAHDIGSKKIGIKEKTKLIRELSKYLEVFISVEGRNLPKELQQHLLKVSKRKIHHVLYFARFGIFETGTMASESAILGTPSIVIHPKAYCIGVFEELEKKYGLLQRFSEINSINDVIEHSLQLKCEEKRYWRERAKRILEEKVDITSFMTWFISNYPESLGEFKNNPKIQYKFR
jgi:predicted glycosyltransferase